MASLASDSVNSRRRRSRRVHERSRVAVFDVFRHSFEDGDRNTGVHNLQKPETKDCTRSNARRVGVSEDELRAHVKAHLETLMNTVRLDAVTDLGEHPNVARSVLNYGFRDLSDLSRPELLAQDISQSIKQSLRDHEPRLVDDSIEVKIQTSGSDAAQRVGLHVMAELIADPADIPVDYEADIDVGSGKVILQSQGR